MSLRLVKAIRWCVGINFVVMTTAMLLIASPSAAQDVAGWATAAGKIADGAAKTASSADGIIRLALQVCIMSLIANAVLVGFILRWLPRISTHLDRLASRPCLATDEDMADIMRRRNGGRDL